MSTLQPRPAYTDAELTTLYPPQLRLRQVQILLRHGERTPITARFRNAGLPAFWPYCSAVRRLTSPVLDPADGGSGKIQSLTTLQWQRRLETFGSDDAAVVATGPAAELDAICDMGMLTDRGRETTTLLGRRLRNLYVDQLGFLPPTLADGAPIYLRATPVPRALESLQQALYGLYPPASRSPDLSAPTILIRSPADETLFPNDGNCRRFAALARAFAQRAASRWNDTDDMAFLTKRLGRWMPDESPRVAVDARPRLSGLMDTINATAAHGPATRLPKEFYEPEVKRIMEKIGVEEWYAGYKESQEYRALGIGGLLGDVVARMVGSAEHSSADGEYELDSNKGPAPPVRFGMSGCHDTTLAGALASLGAYDTDAWPPFTSHIAIELFRRAGQDASAPATSTPAPKSSRLSSVFGWVTGSGSGTSPGSPPPGIGRKKTPDLTDAEKARLDGYYVRLRYNDNPVTIPGCKPVGKHLEGDESFCTLEAFKAIVDKFTPVNWKQQCRTNIKDAAFPSKPEPAGY
ncbi:histidine phosphatase superfamily [Dactylonectria macrodidyma]|uniref:3-phytase n=1 Tax=Dactylonectria macrodidyma TaxID=307937 RepID=A0A9P9J0Z2_9HYPO|nr:histidine phosphatase superfamily [Dactylonectria macrodidyma]